MTFETKPSKENIHYSSPSPKRSRRSDEAYWSPKRERAEKDAHLHSSSSKRSSYSDSRSSSHHSSSTHEEHKDLLSLDRFSKSHESGSSYVNLTSSAGITKLLPPIPKVPKVC